jgi:hypothetical protein
MIIPLKVLMDILINTIDRRYYYYDMAVDFNKEAIVVTITTKREPFYSEIEDFPFNHIGYEDKDFIECCVKEMVENLRDKAW